MYPQFGEGKITDECIRRMIASYEEEQRTLESGVWDSSVKECGANVDSFLIIARKYADIQELTAEIFCDFMKKVYVY